MKRKRPATKPKKSTQAVTLQRIEEVLKIRLLGGELSDLRQYASENDPESGRPWRVTDRQLFRYVQAADKLLKERAEKDLDKLFDRHVGQRRLLWGRAMESGDWRTALAVAKDEAELFGLYAPTKHRHEHEGEVRLKIAEVLIERKPAASSG